MRTALLAAAATLTAVLAMVPAAHGADAVVAFVDGGINPYHVTFRDNAPRARQHPSTYLPGFPADARALELTFDAENYASAVAADCEVWRSIERGKLYWVPGTKIVGAISFETVAGPTGDCETGKATRPWVLDNGGHGTMVASRGASVEYGACRECLIVAVQRGNNGLDGPGPYQEALRWTAANRTWIDAQSNSWGPIAPVYEPTDRTILGGGPALIRTIEATARVQPAFWASGNGAAFRGGVAGHPTPLSPHLTPSAISVGGHDSGQVAAWPGFPPHLVADACNAFAADHRSLDRSDGTISSGTSGATPYVAGSAAQILRDARAFLGSEQVGVHGDVLASGPAGLVADGPLTDGVFTVAELRRTIFLAGSERPARQAEDHTPCGPGPYGPTPVAWSQVPEDAPEHLLIGYGALDRAAVTVARDGLRAGALPPREQEDEYFATDDASRRSLHGVYTQGQAEDPPAAVPAAG